MKEKFFAGLLLLFLTVGVVNVEAIRYQSASPRMLEVSCFDGENNVSALLANKDVGLNPAFEECVREHSNHKFNRDRIGSLRRTVQAYKSIKMRDSPFIDGTTYSWLQWKRSMGWKKPMATGFTSFKELSERRN